MKGSRIQKGELSSYTRMKAILAPIKEIVLQYNWLLTDCEWVEDSQIWGYEDGCEWLSGEAFFQDIEKGNSQFFIWGVFSAFDKSITQEEALSFEKPTIQHYYGYSKNPVRMQHPLAQIEILAVDSSFAVFISKDDAIVDLWSASFPWAEDLETDNRQHQ